MGMNAYMCMNAYTFMPIIGIYTYMGIYYIGISFMPMGIYAYMGIQTYIDIYAFIGKMPRYG